jgi:hypothetical protein
MKNSKHSTWHATCDHFEFPTSFGTPKFACWGISPNPSFYLLKEGIYLDNRMRKKGITIRVTDEEKNMILSRMKECGITSLTKYVRLMAIDGCILKVDYSSIKEFTYEINKIGVNINQIAHNVNSTNSIYKKDIQQLKEMIDIIWQYQKSILSEEP